MASTIVKILIVFSLIFEGFVIAGLNVYLPLVGAAFAGAVLTIIVFRISRIFREVPGASRLAVAHR